MATDYRQSCLVCGLHATLRCSGCAKAGIDLFFCSKEHQSLVWPTHRQVCGPGKANPFLFPFLSSDELADMMAHLNWKNPDPVDEYLRFTLSEMYQVKLGEPPETLPFALPLFFTKKTELPTEGTQKALVNFRNLNHSRHQSQNKGDPTGFWAVTNAYEMIGYVHKICWQGGPFPSWYSELHHRLAIHAAIVILSKQAADSTIYNRYVDEAWTRITELISQRVAAESPTMAAMLFHQIRMCDPYSAVSKPPP
ncbi:zinc finger MYND domain-containing protein [Rhodotorula paludigena]|uniref:zinc finger MYND domain-containing protein n=1 Tax=Rhodotorula paludigena TaxID=86838 RepID=UPI003171B9CE